MGTPLQRIKKHTEDTVIEASHSNKYYYKKLLSLTENIENTVAFIGNNWASFIADEGYLQYFHILWVCVNDQAYPLSIITSKYFYILANLRHFLLFPNFIICCPFFWLRNSWSLSITNKVNSFDLVNKKIIDTFKRTSLNKEPRCLQ